jgi:hypothetical protein
MQQADHGFTGKPATEPLCDKDAKVRKDALPLLTTA